MLFDKWSLGGRLAVGLLVGSLCVPALAGSHTWKVNELFSNANGTVQFIELKEDGGAENAVGDKFVTSNTHVFDFPGNLAGSTLNKTLLLATDAFAALPGAPARDYAIPANFFSVNGDTIKYAPAQGYDTFTFGSGVLPTNGVNSLKMTNFITHTFTTNTANTPANFVGGSGSVNAACADKDGDGYGNPGDAACPNGSATDCNDGDINIHPGAAENTEARCTDLVDNDCDTFTDCDDSNCALVIPCIPTVSEWGLVVMTLLVLTSGAVLLQQRWRTGRTFATARR